uniref:Uncharacterized protein n=1 Tax=Neobodo designis TaxID=312471 RepID=A0A7S1L6P6_NEODS
MRIVPTVLLLLCGMSAVALACSCINPGDTGSARAQYALENFDLVFLANVGDVADTGSVDSNNVVRNATLTITDIFKAPASAALSVGATLATSTDLTCCLCGYNVSAAQHLISIYRAAEGPPYSLSSCSVNCAVGSSTWCSDTVAALQPPSQKTSPATHSFMYAVPGAVTMLLMLAAVFYTA